MPKQIMGTVDKALSLLHFFSPQTPEIGLSEFARKSGYDKATTLRCLVALERNGFVEQDIKSRKYRVGLTPYHLAQIREQSFPVEAVILSHLDTLASTIGETAHGTLMAGQDPVTIAVRYPDRALFVHVDESSALPWHATASGIAIAAHQPEDIQAKLLGRMDFAAFTRSTLTDQESIRAAWAQCRNERLAYAHSTFEDDVVGTAAPIFGQSGTAIGAIAIASVFTRLTSELRQTIEMELIARSQAISNELAGVLPSR